MNETCTLSPTVNGKRSKLFRDLKSRMGQQSQAALFWGIAHQPDIVSQFTKRDFDSNGELLYNAYAEKFDLASFISTRQELEEERVNQGVVNSKGEAVVFEDPDAQYQRILDYNSSQNKFRMVMQWDSAKDGYVINLDRTGINNVNINSTMQRNMAAFKGYIGYLSKVLKHEPVFDDTLKKAFANFNNVRFFADTIVSLARQAKDYRELRNLTPTKAALLLAFYGDTMLGQRIINTFGENTVQALVETSQLTSDKEDTMEAGLRDLLRNFLKQATSKATGSGSLAAGFIESSFRKAADDAVQSFNYEGQDVFGINETTLSGIIKDLKTKFMVDKNIRDSSGKAIKTLSDASEKFLQIAVRRMAAARRNGENTKELEDTMTNLKKLSDKGMYVQSIAGMLAELEKHIDDSEFSLLTAIDSLQEGVGLTNISLNTVSSALLYTLKLGSAYGKLLEDLEFLDGIELNQQDIPVELLDQIKTTAKVLSTRLREQVNNVRRKQFDVLYAFYLPMWGGTDVKVDPEGNEHSLKSILMMLSEDPNILDRMIYSLNESNDEALGLLHQAVLDRQRARNKILHNADYFIRDITNALYQTGSNSSFMFEQGENGLTGLIVNPYGFTAYRKARREYIEKLKEQGLQGDALEEKLFKWEKSNTKIVAPFVANEDYSRRYKESLYKVVRTLYGDSVNPEGYAIDKIIVPADRFQNKDALDNFTEAQKQYYFDMMALKSVMQMGMPNYDTNFFNAPQLQKNFIEILGSVAHNPSGISGAIANMFNISTRREDENYEETMSDLLHGNAMRRVIADIDGTELMRLPLFFTHQLKDKSTMSTDFSSSMLAMSAAAVNYTELNKVLDTLMLTKDWLLTQREQGKTEGERKLVDLFKWGKDVFLQSVMKEENAESGLIVDFFEKDVYGKLKKDEEVSLFGTTVKLDKTVDWLTGFTSRTGLAVNILGSQANLLVGKLQGFIEGFAGEFFSLGDMGYAEAKYFQLIMPYLLEYNSNNKSSLLGLLSEKFDVQEGFYQNLRRQGFQSSLIGKILGNANLFMLYGMGEHLLHNETMLAILHRVKVRRKGTQDSMNLLNAYEQCLTGDDSNKRIQFNPEQWELELPDGSYRDFTAEDEERIEKQIAYCNKTMHGAFGDIDKGMIHRYALGRLVMNFRQWMPGHYGRRYRTMHYDADLGEYRQGYYQSAFKFVVDTVKELKRAKFDVASHWNELSDTERANLKRAIAETALLVLLTVQNISLGEYKDKRGSWAYRNLMYQTKRMLMETKASTPLSGFGPQGFVANMINILNSPVAAVATIQDIVTLMDLTKLFVTIEGGQYDGENLYMHNLKRRVPYVGQIIRQSRIGKEDYIFQVFE